MSAKIPQSYVEALLNKVDIVELIASKVKLKKAGRNYQARCPFHNEKTPSFVVFAEKQNFHCFGCQAHGDAITFLREQEGLGYLESLEKLASLANMPWPPVTSNQPVQKKDQELDLLNLCAQFYEKQLRSHPDKQTPIHYLKARGISGKVAKNFALGFAPSAWDALYQHAKGQAWNISKLMALGLVKQNQKGNYFDMFRNRIIFPIRNRRGNVLGFGGRILGDGQPKYLNSQDSPIFHKSSVLYGLYEAKKIQQVLVVEGYMDVIALHQYGFTNAVATLGTAFTDLHFKRICKISQDIIFCFDGDKAGRQAALKTIKLIFPLYQEGLNIKYLFLAEGDDPDSFIRKHSKQAFELKLSQALPLSEYFVQSCLATEEDSIDITARGLKLAREYLQLLPDGYFKAKLQTHLAKVLDVDIAIITGKLGNYNFAPQHFPRKIISQKAASLSLIEKVIACLLHKPEIALSLDDTAWLLAEENADYLLLHDLITLIKTNKIGKFADILASMDSQRTSTKLSMLFKHANSIPSEGIEAEFKDAFKRLAQTRDSKQIETLLAVSKTRKLTEQEKRILQQLIQSK